MFFGTVPTACISQVFRVVDFNTWPSAHVCCSGTFRLERALYGRIPHLPLHSNDVSLYSSGLETIDVMVITTQMPKKRRVSLALSHNSVVGEDDPAILFELYSGLDLDEKAYSGLTDDNFKGLEELQIDGMAIGQPKFEELQFVFLPGERDAFVEVLEDITKRAKRAKVLVADMASFDHVYDAIIAVKRHENVLNSALALDLMATLALERLAEFGETADGGEDCEAEAEAQDEGEGED